MRTTVVPDPRNTVSRGSIMAAAALAIRSFSAACATTFVFVARLVGQALPAHGAAVRAGQHAFLFEQPEVAADGYLRDAEILAECGDPHGALRPEPRDDARAPLGGQHLANVWSGQPALPPSSSNHDRA